MAVALMVVLVSCKQNQQLKEMHAEADLSGLKVGMMTGTALDFMIRNISYSPIQDIDQNLMLPVKELSKEIIEEPTTLGFRVKIIV